MALRSEKYDSRDAYVERFDRNAERQIRSIRDFNTKIFAAVICCATQIVEAMNKIGVEPPRLKTGVFVVEKHLEERLGFSPKGDALPPGTLPRSEGKRFASFGKGFDAI